MGVRFSPGAPLIYCGVAQMAIQATQQKCIKNVTEEGDEEDMQPKYLPSVILDHSNLKEM